MTHVLGLIPARGGSKGIPLKNIYPLAGKPLLAYTCQAALNSDVLDRTILSTDHENISTVGKKCGVEVPFLRPRKYSLDDTPSIDVVLHALQWLEDNENWFSDIVVLLQPTSPLRRSEHINEAVELLRKEDADTVVSVVKVPHRYSPYSIQKLKNGLLNDFWEQPLSFERYRRQDQPILYARNGPAVLVTKTSVLKKEKSFYGSIVKAYVMEEKYSVDIDTMFDLQIAECLLTSPGNPD